MREANPAEDQSQPAEALGRMLRRGLPDACLRFCPHGVRAMRDDTAAVANPTGCVILCHNCADRGPEGAMTFPPQNEPGELVCCD